MDILENPFHVLKATPRDRKGRLLELAEELSLHGHADAATEARNVLTNPRNRLAAEAAWFPGLDPARLEKPLAQIGSKALPIFVDAMSPLCHANLLAGALKNAPADGVPYLARAIHVLASLVDRFDPAEVMQDINADRQLAGIPALSDVAAVEAELAARARHYQRVATAVLGNLPSEEMVTTYEQLIAESSSEGEGEAPRLINDLVDAYELHAGEHLNRESARIFDLIAATEWAADKKAPAERVRQSVQDIIQALSSWDRVAQPIQLSRKSRGLDHNESNKLAFRARSLAIHLFNEHDYLEESKHLSSALKTLFSEVAVVSAKVEEDVQALGEIEARRVEMARQAAEDKARFDAEITYETTFGLIFKDKFRISPEGIEYKNRLTPLQDITGVSWGAIKHYTNGVYTGTTYHFRFGSKMGAMEIQFENETQNKEIVSRVWRAICIRILTQMMERWAAGQGVDIGGIEVRDDGIVLKKSRFFKSDEVKFHGWNEMSKGTHNGALNFFGQADKDFKASFSFKDTLNTHILDFAVDKIWEGKASKLSLIFGPR